MLVVSPHSREDERTELIPDYHMQAKGGAVTSSEAIEGENAPCQLFIAVLRLHFKTLYGSKSGARSPAPITQ